MGDKEMTKSELRELNLHDLICKIQPLWNTYNMGRGEDKMTENEIKTLTNALEVYKEKGGDVSYFTQGAGAPGNCIIA